MLPLRLLGTALAPVAAASWLLGAGCQPEQRPGSVERIGGPPSGSVSASVSGVSAPAPGGRSLPLRQWWRFRLFGSHTRRRDLHAA